MNHLQDRKSRYRAALLAAVLLCGVVAMGVLASVASAQSVSFKPASGSPVAAGLGPVSVAVGDFNEDGINDIVVANASDNTITVYLGNGDGTFQAPTRLQVNVCSNDPNCNGVPLSIAVGKFNLKKDQHLDIAVTNIPISTPTPFSPSCLARDACSAYAIFLGDGKGGFSGGNHYLSPGTLPAYLPTSVAVGDFNGDGFPDLAIADLDSGTIAILTGNGDGTFGAPSIISVGSSPSSIATGDFNADSKADLVVTNTNDHNISVLLGNGDGTFGAPTNLAVGVRPVSVAVADLNGDGKPDLVVANLLSSNVSVLLGTGGGSFAAPVNYAVGRYPSAVALADFNGAGKIDIAVVNRFSDVVSVLPGNGDGTFAPASHFSTGNKPLAIAVEDFNGDHVKDIAVVNIVDNTVSILLNNSDTTPPVTTESAAPPPNGNGWNNTPVKVTLTSTDSEPNGSGVKEIHYTIAGSPPVVVPTSPATVNFTTEGIFSLSYFAVDNAGNTEAAHTLTVQIDETPPTITSSQSPPANAAGWNNSDVTVTFACSDTGVAPSGVDTCTSPIVVSTEGANQVETGTATDKAGNTATTTRTINLDKTPPVLTMPTLAASYLLNSSLTLSFGATDALSGVATMQATLNGTPVTSGSTVTLTHLATNTFTLTATDVAGNTATQTATFAVVYNFIGFLPPIPNDGSGLFKLGSTVPVKFQLTDANGTLISTAVCHLTIQMISNNTLVGTPIDATASGNADVGDLFRFDGTQYIFNWSTKPVSTGTWQLQARLDDGTVHAVVMGTK